MLRENMASLCIISTNYGICIHLFKE